MTISMERPTVQVLTPLETAQIDKLRVKLAELGYPIDSIPDEAVAAALIQLSKKQELTGLEIYLN